MHSGAGNAATARILLTTKETKIGTFQLLLNPKELIKENIFLIVMVKYREIEKKKIE
jgi:hypothetical protein